MELPELTSPCLSHHGGGLLTLGEQWISKHEVRRGRTQVWGFNSLIANWIKVLSNSSIKFLIHLPLKNITFSQATQLSIRTLQPEEATLRNTGAFLRSSSHSSHLGMWLSEELIYKQKTLSW